MDIVWRHLDIADVVLSPLACAAVWPFTPSGAAQPPHPSTTAVDLSPEQVTS